MKQRWPLILALLIFPIIFAGDDGDEYIIISWNDLGMHCSNKDFSKLVVLPPYNNLRAQVIRKGTSTTLPQIVTDGFSVEYSIPGNTYSVGKTNFWNYSQQLFGVTLAPNIGLTGVGLTGNMIQAADHFYVDGIPVTPYTDNNLVQESPYQLAQVDLVNSSNSVLYTSRPVIPVSNELSCVSSGCHSSEQSILNGHDREGGFNPANTPILCATCHSDNALGMPGQSGVKSFSFVIHDKHKDKTNNCYKCHPGPNTQCFRDVMHAGGMVCQDCHGNMSQVAQSIENGRQPWLEEPSCGSSNCHGANFAEEPGKLFKESRGHGGLFCSACHGSPHAILPTELPNDNVQNIALQEYPGTLRRCEVCHTVVPTSPGPHGYLPATLNLTLYLEGLFNGETMNKARNSDGFRFPGMAADQITVELHHAFAPYTSAAGPYTVRLNTDGAAKLVLPASMGANYFIVIKHRNSIETWTANPVPFAQGSVYYNFSTAAGQAYGNNLKLISGQYVIFGGDVNQDGSLDTADMTLVDNDSYNFVTGYVSSDITGDGSIDTGDMTILDNNSAIFIGKIVP
ncbi:MAG: hypothetical protein IPN08_11045 [Bacteroidales bacterium]|nr:hypothetical protein [Bacteroidales bacterium]MBK9357909.1 hypothetical protein [Bacteroidales bacterium]